MIFSTLIYVAV